MHLLIISMKKVELLSPAGSYDAFISAINAGADAIYLAGNKFGARAYAENFNDEELLRCIKVAHLFNKKVYLTLNTLVKEKEFNELYDYLKPLVDNCLDGVIVQDVGIIRYINNTFPQLPIHLSTQLSITSYYAVNLLKKYNITRIVPARELSLSEIKAIKNETNIEIESFIHGAMCYSYSGMCLFSSIIGGRSGNRGRCAQPCRLPYSLDNKLPCYPLSMKDMCSIDILYNLIASGIDSFKIEGRMKKPEYCAGVTAIYRKYIDMYYENKNINISKDDRDILNNLYIRSEKSEGYYFKHNGKDMITIGSPAYNGASKELLLDISNKYIEHKPSLNISIYAYINCGDNLLLTATYGDIVVEHTGRVVESAKNAPLTVKSVIKQLSKVGDTFFEIQDINIDLYGNPFISVKELNEARRCLLNKLEDEIIIWNQKYIYQ